MLQENAEAAEALEVLEFQFIDEQDLQVGMRKPRSCPFDVYRSVCMVLQLVVLLVT